MAHSAQKKLFSEPNEGYNSTRSTLNGIFTVRENSYGNEAIKLAVSKMASLKRNSMQDKQPGSGMVGSSHKKNSETMDMVDEVNAAAQASDYKGSVKMIHNSYTRSRGTPQLLELSCAHCGVYLMTYQKDGPGPLLRCYLDRIHLPEKLRQRQFESFKKKSERPKLSCDACGNMIGTPMIYKPENRPAYHLLEGHSLKKMVG